MKEDDFIWKIVQYDRGVQVKKRMGDTKIGFNRAIKSAKGSGCYTYKVFVIRGVEWTEK